MKMDCVKRVALSAAVLGLAGAVTAQARNNLGSVYHTDEEAENQRGLDIVIRDFDVNHPDFENFQEEAWRTLSTMQNEPKKVRSWADVGDEFAITETHWTQAVGDLSTWNFFGYGMAGTGDLWLARRSDPANYGCGNSQSPAFGVAVGAQGLPHDIISESGAVTTAPDYIKTYIDQSGYAWYGEFKKCGAENKTMRGLVNDLCAGPATTNTWTKDTQDGSKKCDGTLTCQEHSWSQIVYTTPGMVQQYLQFDPALLGTEDYVYEPKIVKNRPACDNGFFEQWYTDVEGTNRSINGRLILNEDPLAPGFYEIDKNWNNGGYFPLDSISEDGNYIWLGSKPIFNDNKEVVVDGSYGAQSLSIFCPPYHYPYAKDQSDFKGDNTMNLCKQWLNAGGPKVGTAAATAAALDPIGPRHLRNYGFTMAGYAKFRYKKGGGEVFKFTGDDDMWIFVDGVLVVDLGGTHLAAAGQVSMDYLAANAHGCHPGEPLADTCSIAQKLGADGTWADSSWHYLHFFYADRQTDGSNLRIRSSLSEIAPSRFGQPAANSVLVTVDENGVKTMSIMLNTSLNANTINNMLEKGSSEPAILVMRTIVDPNTGAKSTVVYGYYITAVESKGNTSADGIQYDFQGVLRDIDGNEITTGVLASDRIAFNAPYNDEINKDAKLQASYSSVGIWKSLMEWNKKISFQVTSTSGKGVEGVPDAPENWAVTRFAGGNETPLAPMDTAITRPDFSQKANALSEIAGSGDLPLNYTAELLLTSIPEGISEQGNLMQISDENIKKLSASGANGETSASTTPYVGGKASATGNCFSANGVESCTSLRPYVITGPTHFNVRVFDHMGHFISQYQQYISPEMLQGALGTATQSCFDPSGKDHPVYGETGGLLAMIKMYPVSQNGRMLATGPYIYQVTKVEEAYGSCVVDGGAPQWKTRTFKRTYETFRRGYRRTK